MYNLISNVYQDTFTINDMINLQPISTTFTNPLKEKFDSEKKSFTHRTMRNSGIDDIEDMLCVICKI